MIGLAVLPHRAIRAVGARAPRLWLALLAFSGPAWAEVIEFPESPDQPSAFVTVWRPADFDERSETLEDLLRRTPGVRVRRFGGTGGRSTASVRGSKSEQLLILVDGLRINSNRTGDVDLSTISLRQVERVEVVRGSGASRHGSQAIGGVVSISTRRAAATGAQADAALTVGRYETLGAEVGFSVSGEKNSFAGSYARLSSENDYRFERDILQRTKDSFPCQGSRSCSSQGSDKRDFPEYTRLNADFVQHNGAAVVERRLGDATTLSAVVNVLERTNGQPGGILDKPSHAIRDDLLSCVHASEDQRRLLGKLALSRPLGRNGGIEASVFWRREDSGLRDSGGLCGFLDPALLGSDRAGWTESSGGLSARVALPRFSTGWVSNELRSSAELRLETAEGDYLEDRTRLVGNWFGQYEFSLFEGALRVIPAVGLDAAGGSEGLVRSRQFARMVEVKTENDPEWIPTLGVIWRPLPSLRVKGNVLRTFRRPTFNELFHADLSFIRGNPELLPESGVNRDLGIEWGVNSLGPVDWMRAEAVAFDRDFDESIEWVLTASNAYQPVNTGPARVQGWEAGVAGSLFERVEFSASYTRIHTENEANGQPLPNRPDVQLSAHAGWDFGPGELWVDYLWESEFTIEETGTLRLPSSEQVDAGMSLSLSDLAGPRFPGGLTLSLEVSNLGGAQRIDARGQPLPNEPVWFVRLRGTTP